MKKPSCCFLCDRVGCVPESARTCILVTDMIIVVVGLVCRIIAVCGMSSADHVLESVPWSTISPGDRFEERADQYNLGGEAGKMYFNLWGGLIKLPAAGSSCTNVYEFRGVLYTVDVCKGASWDDLDDARPSLFGGANTTYLSDCKDAALGSQRVVIIGVIAAVFAILSRTFCNSRFSHATDAGKKCTILITTLIPVITSVSAIANYQLNCIDNINDAIDDVPATSTSSLEYEGNYYTFANPLYGASAAIGTGLEALIAGLALNLASFVLQLLVPGNKDGNKPDKDKDIQFTNTQPQAQP